MWPPSATHLCGNKTESSDPDLLGHLSRVPPRLRPALLLMQQCTAISENSLFPSFSDSAAVQELNLILQSLPQPPPPRRHCRPLQVPAPSECHASPNSVPGTLCSSLFLEPAPRDVGLRSPTLSVSPNNKSVLPSRRLAKWPLPLLFTLHSPVSTPHTQI